MDRGAWWATVHGVTKSDTTERLTRQVLENVPAFSQPVGWQWGPWGPTLLAQGWREAWLRAGGRPGSAFGEREPPAAHFLCFPSS